MVSMFNIAWRGASKAAPASGHKINSICAGCSLIAVVTLGTQCLTVSLCELKSRFQVHKCHRYRQAAAAVRTGERECVGGGGRALGALQCAMLRGGEGGGGVPDGGQASGSCAHAAARRGGTPVDCAGGREGGSEVNESDASRRASRVWCNIG